MTAAPRRGTAARPWLLAIDSATSTVVVAAGTPDGRPVAIETFAAGHHHSEHLLPALERLVERAGLSLPSLASIIVGTGPGAFTGLRVGLAVAKTLAHQLGIPITGVSTAQALLAAAGPGDDLRLWLPAGAHDRLVVDPGLPPRRERGVDDDGTARRTEIAVDLPGRASEAALARGRVAVEGLPAALLTLGADRLARGETDDPERIVPEYVTPPRGMDPRLDLERGLAWSRDPR
ncbi:MAG TPA: tRNA (adenosine(37)-N6)-threonylcarbamoyltransferase complex dimerization subunit type 1 TsaB [Candidatus Deferrimicrobiaceae bacterium]|nr:tRNA (adenosine(37)-N6)-threonylcarbamoyltransferase complex dimerization subunit type 1 TsaB [Candidatus Deferrimicrobiaceae bacterium]